MWLLVTIAAIALVGLYIWYALIVTRRNRVAEALAGIDVQLNQRHDLIPETLAVARRYMAHEKELFETVTQLRSAAAAEAPGSEARFAAENQLSASLGRLLAVAEGYPDLKADGPMIEAQRALVEVETNIAAARRFYNSAVGDLANAIQIFPGQLLAGLAGASRPAPFFAAPEATRAPVDAASRL
jgi:LemA protein